MKPCRVVSLLFLLATRTLAADTPVELTGVIVADGRTKLALTEKASGDKDWVEPGGTFKGYAVKSYDAAEETVTLAKSGEDLQLRLVPARSIGSAPATAAATTSASPAAATAPAVPAGSEASPPISPRHEAIQNNLRLLATAARQYQVDHGSPPASVADLVGPDKPIKQLSSVAGENYANVPLGADLETLSVTTAQGTVVSLAPTPTVVALSPAPTPVPPSPTGPSYTVQPGDTLAKIAASTGVTMEQLQALNPGMNPTALNAGQPIRLR